MTNKLVVIKISLKIPKIKKILLYEMKFLVPNYSCLQNPRLVGYRLQIPILSVHCPQLNLLNPPPKQNSWIRHCTNQSTDILWNTWTWRSHGSRCWSLNQREQTHFLSQDLYVCNTHIQRSPLSTGGVAVKLWPTRKGHEIFLSFETFNPLCGPTSSYSVSIGFLS